MKGRAALLVVGLVAVAGLTVYLLVASGNEGGTPEAGGTGSGTTEPGTGVGTSPGSASVPITKVVRPRPETRPGPVAAAADAGVADSIAVPRTPGVKESLAEKLAADARQRQVAMLRVELTSLRERTGKLTKTLARLKSEGGANALQLQQIQRQLQQTIDAQPRVEAQLEKAEQEQREAAKKKPVEKDAPEAK